MATQPKSDDYIPVPRPRSVVRLFSPAELTRYKLTAAIARLQEHYNEGSSAKPITEAKSFLEDVIREAPPIGIIRVTWREKEGIYRAEDSPGIGKPAYVIKRFATLEQANHVHEISQALRRMYNQAKQAGEPAFMKVPNTYWPLQLNEFSVLFMDDITGVDLFDIAPKLTKALANAEGEQARSKEVLEFLTNLIYTCLDDAAYWKTVAPRIAGEGTVILDGEGAVRDFHRNSLIQSLRVLETETNKALTERLRTSLEEYASELASILWIAPDHSNIGYARDLGIKNIRLSVDKSASIEQILYQDDHRVRDMEQIRRITNHVDLPDEWRFTLDLREIVRFLFAPRLGLNFDQVRHGQAYFLVRESWLKQQPYQPLQRQIQEILGNLVNNNSSPEETIQSLGKPAEAYQVNLLIAAIAEAARMTVVIPNLHLSKINFELQHLNSLQGNKEEQDKTLEQKEVLTRYYTEWEDELKGWAQRGITASQELAKVAPRDKASIGSELEGLFTTWAAATLTRQKLPAYRPFKKV